MMEFLDVSCVVCVSVIGAFVVAAGAPLGVIEISAESSAV